MNKVDQAVELAKAVYSEENGRAGGECHIVLDDGNLEDWHIDSCLNEPISPLKLSERVFLMFFKDLNPEEREQVYTRYSEYA